MQDLQLRLGYQFKQEAFLREALTHPSFIRHQEKKLTHNQRLEFLGDAVLQLAVTDKIYELFPEAPEGDLTKFRSRVVSREHMAKLARALDLGADLFLGVGEERNLGRDRESNLADAMESVIGAIYQDGGWEEAKRVIFTLMQGSLLELKEPDSLEGSNAKGTLQELMQKNGGDPPIYQCVETLGEAHDRSYIVAIFWRGQELARGIGKSKRVAETEAAKVALAGWGKRSASEIISST